MIKGIIDPACSQHKKPTRLSRFTHKTTELPEPNMIKLGLSSTLAIFLLVSLTQLDCFGLERKAVDYLIPLYRAKGRSPANIKRDALWIEDVLETQTQDKPIGEVAGFITSLRSKLLTGLSPTTLYQDSFRLAGLANEEARRSSSSPVKIGGRFNVLLRILDSLSPLLGTDFTTNRCNFDNWLTISETTFSRLNDFPSSDAIVISGTGMKFLPHLPDEESPTQLYKYIKYLITNRLILCLQSIKNQVGSEDEMNLDEFFNLKEESNLSDEELWKIAFNIDLDERLLNPIAKSLKEWFPSSGCPPSLRKFLENSAGIITIAVGIAPEEIRKFDSLNFTLAKRMEYLRLCNQIDSIQNGF